MLDNPKSAPEKVQELVYEFAENIITILWCLSYVPPYPKAHFTKVIMFHRETSNKALNAINSISLIPFLMAFLTNRAKLPRQVVHATGKPLLGLMRSMLDMLVANYMRLYAPLECSPMPICAFRRQPARDSRPSFRIRVHCLPSRYFYRPKGPK